MARPTGASGEATRDAIRAAGVRLLAARGYHAVSMRELAAAVGLRAASLYNHVPTKQALLVDLLTRNLGDMLAGADAALAGVAGPRARLAAFIAFHLTFHTARRDEALICTTELRSLEPPHHARVVALRRAYEARLGDILAEGAAAGEFAPGDARITTFGVLAMLTGAATWYRPDGRLDYPALVAEYTRLVLHGLGARDAPRPTVAETNGR
jgi:AcrR family transcriptional regulator